MANRPSNQQRNRWTLNQLAIDSTHRVLEIGCGPGWGLSVACELARDGLVVGVDPSTTMLAQARKRNSESVELGKVKLVQARAEELPDDFGGPFDRVYSSNVFGFLKEPDAVFKTLYQHIKPLPRHRGIVSASGKPPRRLSLSGMKILTALVKNSR